MEGQTMNKQYLIIAMSVLLLASPLTGQTSDSAEVQLKAAMHLELVDGDLKAAIEQYQKIITNAGGNRSTAAKALLQMGQCYEKLGLGEARHAYERVVRDFADQQEIVAQALVRLKALEPRAGANHGTVMTNRRVWSGAGVDTQGAVSAEGRYLTYVDQETGDLAIHNLETGDKRRLTNASSSWDEFVESSFPSADGRLVAYEWYNKDDSFELRVISANGEKETVRPRTLYRNKEVGHIHPAGWSPDSKSILAYLFRADGTHQIALVNARDGSVKVLKSLDWRSTNKLSLSPDGRYVAYDFPPNEDSPEHDIYLLATDGSREVSVVEHPGDDLLLGWMPDGQAVLFVSDRTGRNDIWKLPVATGKPTGPPELVKRDVGRITPFGFSTKGAFYYGIETGIRDVYTEAIDPKSLKPLAAPVLVAQRFLGTNQGADWSADGKYIAYASRRGQVWDSPSVICIRSVETGAEREIIPKLAWIIAYHGLRWSPDGRHIFVRGTDRKGHQGLYKVNAHTGETDPVVYADPAGAVQTPICSPDGDTLYYLRWDHPNMRIMDMRIMARNMRAESEREVFRLPSGYFGPLAMSPDGTRLAFVDNEPDRKSQVLMVIPSEGGQQRVLVRAPIVAGFAGLAWTPDGRQLLFARPDQKKLELWRVSVETGEQQLVKVSPVSENLRATRISPDGRQLAYTAGDVKNEVWVLENFLDGLTAAK
jgi:Tol biopolymer transport system component